MLSIRECLHFSPLPQNKNPEQKTHLEKSDISEQKLLFHIANQHDVENILVWVLYFATSETISSRPGDGSMYLQNCMKSVVYLESMVTQFQFIYSVLSVL